MDIEEKLAGGNMSEVSRVGETVRRETGPWTERVQALLLHMHEKGISETPVPLGFDEYGREILTFLPGTVGHDPLPVALRSDEILVSAAKLLRRIHDATEDVAQSWLTGWQAAVQEPVQVICHGDFAPYNCVFDGEKLVGVIDFDHAHPGPRAWDLAYALYRFAPLTDPSNPDNYGSLAEQARRARLFCDAYGFSEQEQIIPVVKARVAFMATWLRDGAARGDRRLQANIDAGHLAVYETDYRYLDLNEEAFVKIILSSNPG
jgi:hypothetical protein